MVKLDQHVTAFNAEHDAKYVLYNADTDYATAFNSEHDAKDVLFDADSAACKVCTLLLSICVWILLPVKGVAFIPHARVEYLLHDILARHLTAEQIQLTAAGRGSS